MAIETNKLEHPCFPQPDNINESVWRYMDLPKFVWLLTQNKLYFPRIDFLDDPHEGSITKSDYFARKQFFTSKGLSTSLPVISEVNKKTRKSVYVNCWHLNSEESEAMWKLYCGKKSGVAIRTSYNSLVSSIDNDKSLYVGKVTYINYDTEWFPGDNMFYSPMHKRSSFSFENEIRLVKSLSEHWGVGTPDGPDGITIDWDVDQTVQEIYVNPYADKWYFGVVKSVVEQFSPQLIEKLKWSKMKDAPIY